MDWSDYEIRGSAAAEVEKKGQTRWRRRVEETQVSDRVLAVGAVVAVLAVLAGWAAQRWG